MPNDALLSALTSGMNALGRLWLQLLGQIGTAVVRAPGLGGPLVPGGRGDGATALGLLDGRFWRLARQVAFATVALLHNGGAPVASPPKAARYAACLVDAQERTGVPWERVAAVIHHESQWRADAVSPTNDYGLGQIHCPSRWCGDRQPSPAERANLMDPCNNIHATASELAHKRHRCRRTRGVGACRDGAYVALYNPGMKTYADSIRRLETRYQRY